MSSSSGINDSPVVPDFLQRRNLPPNESGSKGFLSDIEVVILSLLDESGKLSSQEKLQDFLVILARMETVDHRSMAVEIIRDHVTEEVRNLFVKYGGFRLLKDWLSDAEKDRYLHFIIAVIKLCRILPFDKAAIKQSEIGKIIKRLTKFESKRQELAVLRNELKMIMEDWRDKQQIATQLEREQEQEIKLKQEQEQARRQEKKQLKQNELQQKLEQSAHREPENQLNGGFNESKDDNESKIAIEAEDDKVPPKIEQKRVLSSGSQSKPILPVPVAPIVQPKVPQKSTPLLTALLQNQALQQQPNAFTSGAAAVSAKATKRTIDMVQGAHEMLNQSSNRSASPSEPVLTKIDLTVKPLSKGGLKKKEDVSKKERKSIRWADEEGGNLREVQTIEVERIKSSVANYKSHKDLVKRERQIEKETHLSKTSEAMHATTTWRSPKALSLTIDIIDNIGRPENCTEIATQTKRLSILMETKYLDESLIPSDPDRSLADEDAAIHGGPADPPTIIPWLMNDEVDEDAILAAPLRTTIAPSSSSGLPYQDFSTVPLQTQSIDYTVQIQQLPRMIQMLDPMTLQMVLDDPVVLNSLVRPDGSVNDIHLDILQNCSSIDEYRQAISYVSEPEVSTYGNDWQNSNSLSSIPNSGMVGSISNMSSLLFNHNASMQNHQLWGINNSNIHVNGNFANLMNNLSNLTNNTNGISNMHMNNLGSSNNSSSFSTPSSGLDFSTIDGARLSQANKQSGNSLSTRATIPCKFFNTLRGCANGDKCPFGHFRSNTTNTAAVPNILTATTVSNLMGDQSQRRGPGNSRGTVGGRGPGQKGGRGGFRS